MEHAIFITKINNLRYWKEKFTRIYFGNEFCQTLLPSKKELEHVLSFVKKNKLNFTLVTPYVTDYGLIKLDALFEFIKNNTKIDIEVVINDFGVLSLINEEYSEFVPILGRLLSKQKKGPRILNIKDKLPAEAWEHFQSSNVEIPVLQEFLIEKKVKRIELDNLLQGIKIKLKKIKGSLYYPYANITTTRLCLINGCDQGIKKELSITPCKKECQKYSFELRNNDMPVVILLNGNSQFFKNDKLPYNLEEMGIDRLIFEPEVPI